MSTPHSSPQIISFNISKLPDSGSSGKDTESKAEEMHNAGTESKLSAHPPRLRAKHEVSMVAQSLQLATEEFRKIHKPKISKLKDGYSANAMLVFISSLKDVEMCTK